MHIIHNEIGVPIINIVSVLENVASYEIAPLPNGYGVTLGNTLRRVLISSVPGTAVSAVRIKGITHEYSTVTGLKDSILDFCLNIKQVVFKKVSDKPEIVTLKVNSNQDIYASNIELSSGIEVLNPDLLLSTANSDLSNLEVEIKLEKGVGYISAEENLKKDSNVDNWIHLDVCFSPVIRVKYDVVDTRVGDRTNLDKVTLEIETNGSITPEDSLKFSASILQSYFELFQKNTDELVESSFMATLSTASSEESEDDTSVQENYTPIEVLNLSPRTLNALINGDVGSIEELIRCTPARLENLRGFGKKAMDEVDHALKLRKLSLSED